MSRVVRLLGLLAVCLAPAVFAHASVVPDYADNTYQNRELTRAEQKCIDEGYRVTYANCSNQTAPSERCPHHDSYYRSCSQEQWCRNNNYTILANDCKRPLYPTKLCDNRFPLYRSCQENSAKACVELGYVSSEVCQLSNKLCPYSKNYGTCCNDCPEMSHRLNQIPEGYVATGESCTTCEGIVKTNIRPADCPGFSECPYGPLSAQTPSCRQGEKILYTACKTAADLCREQGFTAERCNKDEDAIPCAYDNNLKQCRTNCLKLARKLYPDADLISGNTVNPVLDLTKTELRSLVGLSNPDCRQYQRPVVTLNITRENLPMYREILDRKIENVDLMIYLQEPLELPASGSLRNTRITFFGAPSECQIKARQTPVSGIVSFVNAPNLCTNFNVAPDSKLLSEGSVTGNINLGKDSALGLKGNLIGGLKTGAYSEVFIKGRLEFADPFNYVSHSEGVSFGCNSKNKIVEGIILKPANLFVKQYAKIDTPKITLVSTSDNIKLANSLSSLHIYKYANIFSSYDNLAQSTIFPLIENPDSDCDDKYYIHLGSAAEGPAQSVTIEPSFRIEDRWKCRDLSRKQMTCD